MLKTIFSYIYALSSTILPVMALTIYAKRRKLFWLRLLISCGFFIAITFIPDGWMNIHWTLEFLHYILIGIELILTSLFLYKESFTHDLVIGCSSYALQHLSYEVYIFILKLFNVNLRDFYTTVYFIIAHIAVELIIYLIAFFLFTYRNKDKGGITYKTHWVVISVFLLLFCILLNMWNVKTSDKPVGYAYDIIGTALTLALLFYMTENTSMSAQIKKMQNLWKEKEEFFKLSKDNMDALNRKCHDLKHVLSKLNTESTTFKEYSADLEKTADLYDILPKTENEALNTILTEKALFCQKNDISLTYMCDATLLTVFDTLDLYTLLGNALDNACECAIKLQNKENRIINLVIKKVNDFVHIEVDNCFEGTISFKDGLPITSKKDKDNHGFGTKSMHYIAEKYHGEMSIHTKDNIFCLTFLIPLTKENQQ